MKKLYFRPMVQKGIALCILPALLVVYSTAVLAVSVRHAGELILTKNVASDSGQSVTVNGEPAASGRTLFASSIVTTPTESNAVLDMGKGGKIELAPNSTFAFNSDGTAGGTLISGNMTLISAGDALVVKSANGETLSLNSGESVAASGSIANRAQTGPGGVNWWIWALIIGGVVTGVVIATTRDGDSSPASPVR